MKSRKLLLYLCIIFSIILSTGYTQTRFHKQLCPRNKTYLHHQKIRQLNKGLPLHKKSQKYAEDQILVKFKPSVKSQSIKTYLAIYNSKLLKKIPVGNIYQVQIPEGTTVKEMVYTMSQNANVEYAGPNFIAHITVTPDDTFFDYQYALYNSGQDIGVPGSPQGKNRADIKATAAWEESKGVEEVIIAIIDTGVDLEHPDLVNKIVSSGRDFVNDDLDATDDNSHGTFVAGIAAAETNNNEGVAGVAWNCKILPIKCIDDEGSGFYSWIIEGIYWAVDNNASVINLSIGGPEMDPGLEEALKYAFDNNVVIVAAAGNEAEPVLYPAAYTEYCLAVAASDYDDNQLSWSNYGPEIDVAAPGERIVGCVPSWFWGAGSIPYAFGSGTSYSSPHVAGFAALIKSSKDWLTASEIMDIICYSADDVNSTEYPGKDDYIGYGRINMEKALVPIKITN